MITVIHLAENVVLVDGLRTYELMKGQYAAMELPPRYPVPAMVYEDHWQCSKRDGHVIYRVLHDYLRCCWTFFHMSGPDEAYMVIQYRNDPVVETIWFLGYYDA